MGDSIGGGKKLHIFVYFRLNIIVWFQVQFPLSKEVTCKTIMILINNKDVVKILPFC